MFTDEDYQDMADLAFADYLLDLEHEQKEKPDAFSEYASRLDAELRPGADPSDPALSI